VYSRIPHGESHTNVNLDVAIEMLENPGKVLYANFHPYPGESGVLHRNHQTDNADCPQSHYLLHSMYYFRSQEGEQRNVRSR
jgi:hypothetical protein